MAQMLCSLNPRLRLRLLRVGGAVVPGVWLRKGQKLPRPQRPAAGVLLRKGRRRLPRPQRPVAGVRLLRSRDRKRRRSQAFPRRSTAVGQALARPVAAGAALHRRSASTAWLLT